MSLFKKKKSNDWGKRPHPLLSNQGAANPRDLPALIVDEEPEPELALEAPVIPLVVDAVPAADEAPAGGELEIIAAISAAVHAYATAKGKKARILDIRQRNGKTRSAWGAAGVMESMRGL